MSLPPRICLFCSAPMHRRRTEGHEQFADRKFCSAACYHADKRGDLSLRSKNIELYSVWRGMIHRCTSTTNAAWKNYGGRGIGVSVEWQDFAAFLRDMAPRPQGKTLDRIDNALGYSKENCRWATVAEQNRNRRNNIIIDGTNLKDYCDNHGLRYGLIKDRMRRGWTIERAASSPLLKGGRGNVAA